MELLEWLNQIDKQLLLAINGSHTLFFDHFFSLFTSKEIWYPLYLLLLVLIIYKYKTKGIWVILFLVLSVIISDQLSGFIKDTVQRLRPSHNPALAGLLNLPAGAGGLYGFLSSHATNAFALTVLIGSIAKSKRIWVIFVLWAALTAYSRIYVGVHFPFDVTAGAILGSLIGWGMYALLQKFDEHFQRKQIAIAGKWKSKLTLPLMVAVVFITLTLLIVSKLLIKLL